jgi:hypothetical protein
LSPDADTHATLEDAQKSVRAIISSACLDAIETPEGDLAPPTDLWVELAPISAIPHPTWL